MQKFFDFLDRNAPGLIVILTIIIIIIDSINP